LFLDAFHVQVPCIQASSRKHLKAADSLEGLTMVDDLGFAPAGGPADGQHIEAGPMLEQPMTSEEIERERGEPVLLGVIHRLGRPGGVATFRGANLDEYDASAIQGNEVNLAERSTVIASKYTIAGPAQKASGGALRARAEPAPPPRFSRV
jgi:hypothetical protein